MLPLCLVESGLRLGDRLLATLPFLRLGGLFLPPFGFALPLGSLVLQGGLARRLVVGLAGRLLFRQIILRFFGGVTLGRSGEVRTAR